MLLYLRWAANTVLFVSSCFLTADIANSFFAAALTPAALDPSIATAAPPSAARRAWEDRKVILSRNLFDSSTLAADTPPEIVTEELEATKLPLTLLGTAAATDEIYSWAAIKDRDSSETRIVRIGDEIRPTATVMRIERRRVVLDENGLPRELVLDEKDAAKAFATASRRTPTRAPRREASPRRRTAPSRRPPAPTRLRSLGENAFGLDRSQLDATLLEPQTLLGQARFMPKFEAGDMVGLQVNDPKPGSLFEQAGIGNGDVITEINGVRIDSAEKSQSVLMELEESDQIDIVVLQDGEPVTKTLSISNR